MFVYSYIDLVQNGFPKDGDSFIREFGLQFESIHQDELRTLSTIQQPLQLRENSITKLYIENKYRIPLNTHVYFNLLTFLESNGKTGGTVILYLLQTYCDIRETSRGPIDQFSFEAIINQANGIDREDIDLQEGIPGAFTGVTNKDIMSNTVALKLGSLAMDPDLSSDVRAELEDEDLKIPAEAGKLSLVEEFDQNIKREDSADGPTRADIPYPPSRARDVTMEVQKIKENRDRFRIESRTGGIGPAVSICMFTFHNTLDT
jgi:transcription initiation factor TFIID subunit 5